MSVERQRLMPWLIDQINSGNIPGLEWINEEKTVFKIPWKHAGKPGFEIEKHAVLFRKWALHTEKYKEGEKEDPSTWKTRFRCALYKLPDLELVKEDTGDTEEEPFRIYKLKKIANTDLNNNTCQQEMGVRSGINVLQDKANFEEVMDWDECFTPYSDTLYSPESSGDYSSDTQQIIHQVGMCKTFDETSLMPISLPADLESIDMESLLPLDQNCPTNQASVHPLVISTQQEVQHISQQQASTQTSSSKQTALSNHSVSLQLPQNVRHGLIRHYQLQSSPPELQTTPKTRIKVQVYYLYKKMIECDVTAPAFHIFSGNGFYNLNKLPLNQDEQQKLNEIYGDCSAEQISLPPDDAQSQPLLYQLLTTYFLRGILIEQTNNDIYVTRLCQARVYFKNTKLEREKKTKVFCYEEFKNHFSHLSAGRTKSQPSADIFLSIARNYSSAPFNCPLITIGIKHGQASQDLENTFSVAETEILCSIPNAEDNIAIQAEKA